MEVVLQRDREHVRASLTPGEGRGHELKRSVVGFERRKQHCRVAESLEVLPSSGPSALQSVSAGDGVTVPGISLSKIRRQMAVLAKAWTVEVRRSSSRVLTSSCGLARVG
jgi:hypothetical protein